MQSKAAGIFGRLTRKRQAATGFYRPFKGWAVLLSSGFIPFFQMLIEDFLVPFVSPFVRGGTSSQPTRCQPIRTRETL